MSVERRVPGAWERVALATTAGDGSFSAVSPPLSARTAFRAVVGASLSPSVRAEVRPHLDVMRHGSRLRVMIDPAGPARVTLSGLNLDTYAWHPVARRALSGGGEATLPLARAGVYRVTVAAARGLSEATSAPIQFRPVRFHR